MTPDRIAQILACAEIVGREITSPSIVPDLADDCRELVAEIERLTRERDALLYAYRALYAPAQRAWGEDDRCCDGPGNLHTDHCPWVIANEARERVLGGA